MNNYVVIKLAAKIGINASKHELFGAIFVFARNLLNYFVRHAKCFSMQIIAISDDFIITRYKIFHVQLDQRLILHPQRFPQQVVLIQLMEW